MNAEHLLESLTRKLFHELDDFFLSHERRFDIDLRELGLTVRAQVLVAKALDDLIVAVEARNHEKLLEKLRRLRKRKEVAGVHARGNEIIAGALRRRAGEHRGFDIDKAFAVEEPANGHRCTVT